MLIKKGHRNNLFFFFVVFFFFFWGGGDIKQSLHTQATQVHSSLTETKTTEPLPMLIAPILLCTVSCLNLKIAIKPSLARSHNNF